MEAAASHLEIKLFPVYQPRKLVVREVFDIVVQVILEQACQVSSRAVSASEEVVRSPTLCMLTLSWDQ